MTHVEVAHQYALDVLAGEVVAGRYVKLACQRYLDDRLRADLFYDVKAANRECRFIETLPHVKGKWAAKKEKIKLEPWQCFIECNLFGFKRHEGGPRRFRESYEEVARKNAKSTRLAGRALYMFCEDQEHGAEIYSGATTERQAWEVFRPMREMVRRTPALKNRYDIEVAAKTMFILSDGSRAEPLIGKPGDGSSPSFAVVDEYHEHDSDSFYETMLTGMGAREQPLISAITTSGFDMTGPCFAKRTDMIRILEGSAVDDGQFAIIYTIDEGDDWSDPATLIKANPNLDVSISRDFLISQLDKARRSASLQNAYKTKHLCQWVGAKTAWLNMLAWQRQKRDISLTDFAGKQMWIGIDLASKTDMAAIGIVIPDGDKVNVFAEFFIPESALQENDMYRLHADILHVTPGNATDYGFIEERIKQLAAQFTVVECGFDQWQAQYLAQRLLMEGLPMVEFPHQVRTFSDPMKEIEALVLDGRLFHDGDPVLTWCMSNTVVKADAKENVFPTKNRNDHRVRIDGTVALIMAMGRYLASKDDGSFDSFLSRPVRFA